MHFERVAGDILHHHVVDRALDTEIVHLDNVGMAQAGDGGCLALEPSAKLFVGRKAGCEHLDGNVAVQQWLVPLVDFGHPSLAQRSQDAIVAQLHARQLRRRTGFHKGGVGWRDLLFVASAFHKDGKGMAKGYVSLVRLADKRFAQQRLAQRLASHVGGQKRLSLIAAQLRPKVTVVILSLSGETTGRLIIGIGNLGLAPARQLVEMVAGNLQEKGVGTGQFQGQVDLFLAKARTLSLLRERRQQATGLVTRHQAQRHLGEYVKEG